MELIDRQAAIDVVDSETVSTNPEHFKSSEKFIKFMDDADIASFGKWQWANGFNTALTATTIQLKNLPSAQPEIIRCKDCKHQEKFFHTDGRRKGGGYYIYGCDFAEGYSHVCLDDDFCSRAERRTDE